MANKKDEQSATVELRSVKIGGKDYTLQSDNKPLLKKMKGGKRKDEETGKWVDVEFPYIPAEIIYKLMDGLFDSYEFKSHPTEYKGEEYVVDKKVYNPKTRERTPAKETVRVYGKRVSLTIYHNDDMLWYEGYAEGVIPLSIATSDPARNGFMNKLAFRARKEALKNLGNVFRTYDNEDEDLIIEEVDDAKSTPKKSDAKKPADKSALDKVNDAIDSAETPSKPGSGVEEINKEQILEDIKRAAKKIYTEPTKFKKADVTTTLGVVRNTWTAKRQEKGGVPMQCLEEVYKELLLLVEPKTD